MKKAFLLLVFSLPSLFLHAQNTDFSNSLDLYTYDIVFHVIHLGEEEGQGSNISRTALTDAINKANNTMAAMSSSSTSAHVDTKLRFRIAQLDANCEPTTGINRFDGSSVGTYLNNGINFSTFENVGLVKDLSHWDTKKFINVWIVHDMTGANGFADVTLSANTYTSESFGIMLPYDYLGNLAHELGHIFGLTHSEMLCESNATGLFTLCAAQEMRFVADTYLPELTFKEKCVPQTTNEAAIGEIKTAAESFCSGEPLKLQFDVRNLGSNVINELSFDVHIGNNTVQGIILDGLSIAYDSTALIEIEVPTSTVGEHELVIEIQKVNTITDVYLLNNSTSAINVRILPLLDLSTVFDFESGPPTIDDIFVNHTGTSVSGIHNGSFSNGTNTFMLEGMYENFSSAFASESSMGFCADAGTAHNTVIIYDRKSQKISSTAFGTFVNNEAYTPMYTQIVPYTHEWVSDTIDLTAYTGIVPIEFSFTLKYKSTYLSNRGDAILFDNFRKQTIVNEPYHVDFIASNRIGCQTGGTWGATKLPTNFMVIESGGPRPVKYEWFVEDAYPSYGEGKISPVFSYNKTNNGAYDVKLRWTLIDGKKDSLTKVDYIRTATYDDFLEQDFDNYHQMTPNGIDRFNEFGNESPVKWDVLNGKGAYGESSACYGFNYEKVRAYVGTGVTVRSKKVSFGIYSSLPPSINAIIFDYAYIPRYSTNVDSLKLMYFFPCSDFGDDYTLKSYTYEELVVESKEYDSNVFEPTDDMWKTDTINISELAGSEDFAFSFLSRNNYSSNGIYFDNIRFDYINFDVVGIDRSTLSETFKISPNPVVDEITLPDDFEGATYEIITTQGVMMQKGSISGNKIDTSNLPSSFYIIRISDKETLTSKFIKL